MSAYPRPLTRQETISYLGHVPAEGSRRCWVFRCQESGAPVETAPTGERGIYCAEHAQSSADRLARKAARYAGAARPTP